VELEPGIEGLIHVSEMSWTKKNVHPGKIVSSSQEVEVVVLEVDSVKRRISLGLKQTLQNPWEAFAQNHPVGSVVEGEVKNKTEFGLFIGLDGDVDGMVHLSDLDWNRPGEQVIEEFKKGHSNRSVLFIGSDPMAFHTAGGIGLTRHQSIKHTLDDTPSAYSACAHAIARCASGETPSAEFNDDDILLSEGGRRHEVFPGGTDEVVNSYDIVDMMDDNVPTVRRDSGY
jgi:predicted RNA-binding protein with RPS1 domain